MNLAELLKTDLTIVPDAGSDSPNDFLMVGKTAWLQLDEILLYVIKKDNGVVVVEAYTSSKEAQNPLETPQATFTVYPTP